MKKILIKIFEELLLDKIKKKLMISPRISFKNFKSKKVKSSLVRKKLTTLIKEKNEILKSLSKDYKNNFNHKNLKKFKKSLDLE